MAFSEVRHLGFYPSTQVFSPPLSVDGLAYRVKAEINAIQTMSNSLLCQLMV